MDLKEFDDIRPYNDSEVEDALLRIASNPLFENISKYLFPTKSADYLKSILLSCKTTRDFQVNVMSVIVSKILADTAKKLTADGLEYFNDDKKYLLLSNHRDIVLDSAIIQLIFYRYGLQTTQIAVGDNLITSLFIEDIARTNKMIKVVRGVTAKELYMSSKKLSDYIRYSITGNRSSIWIAQRNGRTKDGVDVTEQGVLKMLSMSGDGNFTNEFENLNILPVAISYQYEPCDYLKALELYVSKRQKYVKSEGEDLRSILTGITQFKGNIHISFTKPITHEEIEVSSQLDKNERFKHLASIIDGRIIPAFKLWNNNYIAYDMLYDTDKYSKHYTDEEKQAFVSYVAFKTSPFEGDMDEFRRIFLAIYANPVLSKEKEA